MKQIFRNVLALLGAALAAGILMVCIQAVGIRRYPPPPGLDFNDKAVMARFAATLPVGAFLFVLASYAVGVTAGAWLAPRLSVSEHRRQGVMIGLLFFVASLLNLSSFPHPAWFWIANLLIVPAATWLGLKLGGTRTAP